MYGIDTTKIRQNIASIGNAIGGASMQTIPAMPPDAASLTQRIEPLPPPGTPGYEAAAAAQSAPSVNAGIPSVGPRGTSRTQGQAGYDPTTGQIHTGNPSSNSVSIVNPATGGYMTAPGRDKEGNLTIRAGEQGYQTPFNRANLDPYAQRLGQVGDTLMQRGLGGATMAGLPQVEADKMKAAQINKSGFDAATVAQDKLAGRGNKAITGLESAAAGQVPSVAAIQQQQGIEAAQQAAMSVAASARGGLDQRAAAMRQGQQAGAAIAQQGVAQAAALRAQEMAQARGQLVGAIGQQQQLAQGQGAAAANLATAQAGLGQQAGLANQNASLQAGLANQQGYLGAAGVDAGLAGQGASIYGQGANLGLGGLAFNNQQSQADIDTQMRQQDMLLSYYGINQGVSAQREAAQQNAQASMVGAALNAVGSLGGAAINYYGQKK